MEDKLITGWKVWYVELNEQSPIGIPLIKDDNMTVKVYASKTHNWEDIPQYGLLFLKRYFNIDGKIIPQVSFSSDSYILNRSMLINIDKKDYHKYFKCGISIAENNLNAIKEWVFKEEEKVA